MAMAAPNLVFIIFQKKKEKDIEEKKKRMSEF